MIHRVVNHSVLVNTKGDSCRLEDRDLDRTQWESKAA